MGLYPPAFRGPAEGAGILWFAVVSTVAEAVAAERPGPTSVAQGAEAGGHRAAFEAREAERGGRAVLAPPAVVDAVRLPVVATGGIADGRGVAAALALGASAVQVGTAFLRCPRRKPSGLGRCACRPRRPEGTVISASSAGGPGARSPPLMPSRALAPDAPAPAPYPVQRGLTAPMRAEAAKAGDVQRHAGLGRPIRRAGPGRAGRRDRAALWDEGRRLCSLVTSSHELAR